MCSGLALTAQLPATHQQREVVIPTERGLGVHTTDFASQTQGFFCAAETSYGYSISHHKSGIQFGELDVTIGYRFGDFLRVGAGLGARNYFEHPNRALSHNWGMPMFVNARGNFMGNGYRTVVPFWSYDLGTTFPDGFMLRPTVGIRVGQPRSAFVVSIGYLGQQIRQHNTPEDGTLQVDHPFVSFLTIKLGYEF